MEIKAKTYDERKAELNKILIAVDAEESGVPVAVMAIADKVDGIKIKDLLNDTLKVSKEKISSFTTKKGAKMYSLYDTGFAPVALGQLGEFTLKAKVSLILSPVK